MSDCDVEAAAENGDIASLRFLLDREAHIGNFAVRSAAKNGRVDCLELLLDREAHIGDSDVRFAAENGRFDCLELLLDRKAHIGNSDVRFAAENGRVDCLRLLLDREAHIGNFAVRFAAENGHVECQKLIEASLAFERASKDGHIAAKKWYSKVFYILENKVEVDKRLMRKGKGVFHEPFERVAEYLGHAFNSAGMYGPHSKLDFMSRRAALQFYRNRVR